MAEGIGEKLRVLEMDRARVLLVMPSGAEVKTSDIYALYDRMEVGSQNENQPLSDNDLETPCTAAQPIVADMLAALKKVCKEEDAGDVKVQVSGSGPGIFIYFANDADHKIAEVLAERIYRRAKEVFPDSFLHLTTTL